MSQKGSYVFEKLEGRHQEAAFLAERAQMRLEGFIPLLKRHDFPEEGKILELGCGQGIRTQIMAENFPKTKVIGLDRSKELLDNARTKTNQTQNLEFQEGDLYDLPFENESFDFVYARLVFMHLSDPERALENIKRVLKPGGKVMIEDADRDCMFFEPAPKSFASFWKKVQEGQRRLGGDPNVGRKLAPMLKAHGFQKTKTETQPIQGEGPDIEFLARTLMPSLNVYLEQKDRAEGEAAIKDLKEMAKQKTATFYHFWFVASAEAP